MWRSRHEDFSLSTQYATHSTDYYLQEATVIQHSIYEAAIASSSSSPSVSYFGCIVKTKNSLPLVFCYCRTLQ